MKVELAGSTNQDGSTSGSGSNQTTGTPGATSVFGGNSLDRSNDDWNQANMAGYNNRFQVIQINSGGGNGGSDIPYNIKM